MKFIRTLLASVAFVSAAACWAADSLLVSGLAKPGDFILIANGHASPILIEATTPHPVARTADDLRTDIERISGIIPLILPALPKQSTRTLVIAGVVGQSPLLGELIAKGKLDVHDLAGAWESFVIAVIDQPFPGVEQALVIAGSDTRGAIYGLYDLSETIGVSPWFWWADVAPKKQTTLAIAAGTHRFGPPSVKYRGIFLNDEDWGLQPWAAKTFEPETGDIGPKTYAKICELLLRLKANTLWPAMHKCTQAFNADARNRRVAGDYAIVMGSSHAEPMLRNNVSEWTAPPEDFNYLTHRDDVLAYWEKRVEENGRFDNIYTLGMRGIHDSKMQGPKTDPERIRILEQIFADQRAMIARHVRPEVDQVPQMFCAYKEVLPLYRQGLRVPDDVTLVWPDDNFGYVRNFATPAERQRSGASGVYYHLSYLGAPLSYLWLSTTPPALVWEEMHKAYEHGADRIWIANVGDLKPAEIPTEFFLQMAWDIKRWSPENLANFLPENAARDFSPDHAAEIATILTNYYRLNFQRKPEHLQWWRSKQPRCPSPLTDTEVQERLDAFAQLRARTDALRAKIPAAQKDAFYQLVYYPVIGSALANERFFEGERGNLAAARAADKRLTEETRFFNEQLNSGKWRGIMALEPADNQWTSMRIERWTPPAAARAPVPSPAGDRFISLNAARFTANTARNGSAWKIIPGLGHTGQALALLPTTTAPIELAAAAENAARLDYTVTFPAGGEFSLKLHVLPTHPITGDALRIAVGLDDAPPQLASLLINDGEPEWALGVLDGSLIIRTTLAVKTPGAHTLRIYGIDPNVVLDKITVDLVTPTTASSSEPPAQR